MTQITRRPLTKVPYSFLVRLIERFQTPATSFSPVVHLGRAGKHDANKGSIEHGGNG